PVLDDIFRNKFCPLEPIYVLFAITSDTLQNEITFKRDVNAWLELKFGRLQCDPYFSEYVELFKRMLLAKELKDVLVEPLKMLFKIIHVFVARQMSGVDMKDSDEGKLFDACLDENNRVIKKNVLNVITTELLDKTNAFTYQNRHAREKISLSRDYRSTIYQTKLIRSNFIVDLMDKPRFITSICYKLLF
ncbi:hypothetical protein ALC57_02596, partial [Trachymyrmex cornetzi]